MLDNQFPPIFCICFEQGDHMKFLSMDSSFVLLKVPSGDSQCQGCAAKASAAVGRRARDAPALPRPVRDRDRIPHCDLTIPEFCKFLWSCANLLFFLFFSFSFSFFPFFFCWQFFRYSASSSRRSTGKEACFFPSFSSGRVAAAAFSLVLAPAGRKRSYFFLLD